MAKIQNPQNERGETLATDKRVNELIEERLVPVEESIEEIIEETIPQLRTDIEESIVDNRIDVDNLDDIDFTPIESFKNLRNIQFAGKYVNVVSNGLDGIRVYINEDNSLPQWDGTSVSLSPARTSLYVYDVPAGADNKNNTAYSYVHNSAGVKDITLTYDGSEFTLLKGNYNIEVSYTLNGTKVSKSISLVDEIDSNSIPQNTTDTLSFTKDNFTLTYKKLGYDVAPNGKTPGNLEVSSFSCVIPASELAEGQVKDIFISFKPSQGISTSLKLDLKIYFWTTGEVTTPDGSVSITDTNPDTIYVSGLQYHDGSSTNNKITATINGSNLANGALEKNYIKVTTSGLKSDTAGINKVLTDTKKGHAYSGTIDYAIPTTFKNWQALTVTATYPRVVGKDTANEITRSATSTLWNIHPVSDSGDLVESFITENKRLNSSWEAWNSADALVAGDAVVQNGILYHSKGNYKQGGISSTNKKDWKSLNASECSFYRIFKDTDKKATSNIFTIDGVDNLLGDDKNVEIWVQPHNGTTWNSNKYIANKIAAPGNNGLAASALVDEKIYCELPLGNGTYCYEGLRVQIKIKNTASTVAPITISFI